MLGLERGFADLVQRHLAGVVGRDELHAARIALQAQRELEHAVFVRVFTAGEGAPGDRP